ncbi:translation initiation factor IF-2-like protein [Labeo rohita]|uniref:Translation initiation factor IF-2-like protein n=1 Tax=Labeo rohita TaxID=84645 RepID=A0A498NGV4_LABRO|nr:translation initiation factor IF-2-like protein [Labeo rohita]
MDSEEECDFSSEEGEDFDDNLFHFEEAAEETISKDFSALARPIASNMSEIEIEEYSLDIEDPAAPPASIQAADQAASQATSASQDPTTEPTATSRGRRPSRAATAHTPRCRTTPSPPPSRRQASSPASSYASALSSAPAKGKWTVAGLRKVLVSSGIVIPRRSTKADLLDLYASLQAGEKPNSTPPSRASGRARTGRSAPYSTSGCSKRPRPECRGHQPPPSFSIIRAGDRCSCRRRAGHRLYKPPR